MIGPVTAQDITPDTHELIDAPEPSMPFAGNRLTFVDGVWDFAREDYRLLCLKNEIVAGAQSRLDQFAQSRGFDNILSACTYATSAVEQFAADAQTCVNLRDQTWATLYAVLAQVEAGERPVPAGIDDIAELPELVWPE